MFHNYGGCAIHTVDPEPPVDVTDFLYMYKPATSGVTNEIPASRVCVAQYIGTDKNVVIPNPNYPLSSQYVQVGRLLMNNITAPIDTGVVADGDVMELEVSRSYTGGNPPHYCPILQWSDDNGVWTGLGANKSIQSGIAYSSRMLIGANDNGVQDTLLTDKSISFRGDAVEKINLVYSTITGEATLTITYDHSGTPYVVTKTFNSIAKSTGPTLQLLGNNQGEYFDSGMSIVECKIKKDNVLVLHYVPVYDMSIQKYGLLDLVSNDFMLFSNSYPVYIN